jgi:hypothetical protein
VRRIHWLLDEDAMSRGHSRGLRARGIDVVTTLEAGLAGESDEVLLEHASQQARALFTFNVGHVCHLHATWHAHGKLHAGIVVVPRQRLTIGEQVRGLARLTSEISSSRSARRWHRRSTLQRLHSTNRHFGVLSFSIRCAVHGRLKWERTSSWTFTAPASELSS